MVNKSQSVDQQEVKKDHCSLEHDLCDRALTLRRITIDDLPYFLPEGIYRVTELKKMACIPEKDRLVRVVGAEIIFLKNHECIALDGNEQFECSAGSGQAS